jgi:hypothetical protein
MTTLANVPVQRRMSPLRTAVTGAIVMAALFVLCWIGAVIAPNTATHNFIGLFSTAPVDSLTALCYGAFWATVFGAFSGALLALVYNLTWRLARR